MRRFVFFSLLLIIAFSVGFVPMWAKARESSARLVAATHELNLARARSALTSAVLDLQRGDYEPAREAASNFFTALREETDSGTRSVLSPAQIEAMRPLLDRRDEIITMLARNDPASADQLADLYIASRTIMNP